jgi:hypothetical protein
MLALAESDERRIVTAGEIVDGLRGDMKDFPRKKLVACAFDPLRRDIDFLTLSNIPIADLLTPKSKVQLQSSEEAEQVKATETLLGSSRELLDLTPNRLSHELELRPWDGSYIDIRADNSYLLRLLTTERNDQTGKLLYYILGTRTVGKRSVVDVMQRFSSYRGHEIDLQGALWNR